MAVSARPELFEIMNMMPMEEINSRQALMALPPLIKRLSGLVPWLATVLWSTTLSTHRCADRIAD